MPADLRENESGIFLRKGLDRFWVICPTSANCVAVWVGEGAFAPCNFSRRPGQAKREPGPIRRGPRDAGDARRRLFFSNLTPEGMGPCVPGCVRSRGFCD